MSEITQWCQKQKLNLSLIFTVCCSYLNKRNKYLALIYKNDTFLQICFLFMSQTGKFFICTVLGLGTCPYYLPISALLLIVHIKVRPNQSSVRKMEPNYSEILSTRPWKGEFWAKKYLQMWLIISAHITIIRNSWILPS